MTVRLKIHSLSDRAQWLRRREVKRELQKHGIEVVWTRPDVVLATSEKCLQALNRTPAHIPLVIEDTLDYSTIHFPYRQFLKHERIVGWLRNTCLNSRELYNAPTFMGSLHHVHTHNERDDVAWQMGIRPTTDGESLIDSDVSKIRLALPLMYNGPSGRFHSDFSVEELLPFSERPIDIGFIGQVVYNAVADQPTAAEVHRRRMFEVVMAEAKRAGWSTDLLETNCRDDVPELKLPRRLPHLEYMRRMTNMRIVLAPWGWEAWSSREIQAIMCGCVVIKPRCDSANIYPRDVFAPPGDNTRLFWCKKDFSDLVDVVTSIFSEAATSNDRRFTKANAREMIDAHKTQAVVAVFAEALHGCMKKSACAVSENTF